MLRELPKQRLFWFAAGALASATAMICGVAFSGLRNRSSEILVISASGLREETRTRLLETIGQCLGKFEAVSNPDSYEVRIPTAALQAYDYQCILRNSAPIGDLVKSEDSFSGIPGKVWQGVSFEIRRR
ncbi:hypothetical protein SAMN06272759_104205 [Novosphingobium sp. B1]|nr:hypothetical protein SAMN06272759_104205 [Novosphingobium sp. B1]